MENITIKELKKIGFYKEVVTYLNENTHKQESTEIYRIDGVNSYFSFNPSEPHYKWYYVTEIEDTKNNIHLNVQNIPWLLTLLLGFNIKNNWAK